jgi:hypothetical protein
MRAGHSLPPPFKRRRRLLAESENLKSLGNDMIGKDKPQKHIAHVMMILHGCRSKLKDSLLLNSRLIKRREDIFSAHGLLITSLQKLVISKRSQHSFSKCSLLQTYHNPLAHDVPMSVEV